MGLGLGLVGVGALVGLDLGGASALPLLEVAVVAICYATGPVILSRYLGGLSSLAVIAVSLGVCAIAYAPVAALELLCHSASAPGQTFNIGGSTEVAIVELARRVIERTESNSSIVLVPYENAYGEGFEELGRRRPDTTALRNLTIGFATPLRYERELKLSVVVNEPGVVQILANVIHGK
jgi:hypothetical protein